MTNFTTDTNKTVVLAGVKTKVNLKISEPINVEKSGKIITYHWYSGREKMIERVNALIRSEVIYKINDVNYTVFYVSNQKTNRVGYLVSGSKLEFNGQLFNSDKKLIEAILS